MVEEAGAGILAGNGTGVVASKNAVTVAGDEAIGRVAEGTRNKLERECERAPDSAEVLEDEEDGVRAEEQRFVGLVVVDDEVDRIEVGRIRAVADKDAGGQRTLQRGEAEDGAAIAAEDESDQPVAETADTVVEEDGRRHGSRPVDESSTGRLEAACLFKERWDKTRHV